MAQQLPKTQPERSKSQRRWRTAMILLGISVGWKLVVFTLGAAVPKWIVKDGIDQLPADLRPYGTEAKRIALAKWSGPIERRGVIRGVRVRVDRTVGDPRSRECGGLNARVRAYTYFAIPYSEVRMVCDSAVVQYRVFPKRKRAPHR